MEEYTRKPNTKCFVCKTPIYRRPSQIERNKGRVFCKVSCYGVFCRKEVPCVVCKKPILTSSHKITCSRSCSNKYRTGIKYKIGRPKDQANIFRILKLDIIKNGKGCCERCGYNKKEILQIHHKNRNRKDNKKENLEILCPNCHFEEHYLDKSWMKNKIVE